jgi:catechol 2,3-dioxygenase-like lactoylglutathione lyase family enzyme
MLRLANQEEQKMIRGLKFISIPVKNQDAALKFYTEKLGFKVATDQPFDGKQRWIELLIPGAETGVTLFTPEGHENRIGDFQSLSFWSDDVVATAKQLKARGVEFEQDPKVEPWGTSAIFKDVDNNKFVLSSK